MKHRVKCRYALPAGAIILIVAFVYYNHGRRSDGRFVADRRAIAHSVAPDATPLVALIASDAAEVTQDAASSGTSNRQDPTDEEWWQAGIDPSLVETPKPQIQHTLETIAVAIDQYVAEYGVFTTNNNKVIYEGLTGKNPGGRMFIEMSSAQTFLDPWGGELAISFDTHRSNVTIRSAGKDKLFYTEDDHAIVEDLER